MKMKFLICFMLLLCFQALWSFAHNTPNSLDTFNHAAKQNLPGMHPHIRFGQVRDESKELKQVQKGQKGKGAYGGDMNRRPKNGSNSAIISASLSFTSLLFAIGTLVILLMV